MNMKPVIASRLIEIDYKKDDDWIDRECRDCGRLDNKHTADCQMIARTWMEIANAHALYNDDLYYYSYELLQG